MSYILKLYLKEQNIFNCMPKEISDSRKAFFKNKKHCYFSLYNNLYIYYNTNVIDEIVNKSYELWFKNINQFSDIEENKHWKNKFCYSLLDLSHKKYNAAFKKLVQSAFDQYDLQKFGKRYFILCSSYQPDNNLCWNAFLDGKYNNVSKIELSGDYKIKTDTEKTVVDGNFSCNITKTNTSGACICFDKHSLDDQLISLRNLNGYVTYDTKILSKRFHECLKEIYIEFKANNNSEQCTRSIHELIDLCNLFYKNYFYSGEKEFRYVIDTKHVDLDTLIKQEKAREINKNIIAFKFHKSFIDHITITNSKDENKFPDYEKRLSKISYNEEDFKDELYED